MSSPAVVLGVEHPRGLAIVRSLARAGVPVIGVDFRFSASLYLTRHLRGRYRVDPDAPTAVAQLLRIGREHGGGVLIPTNDEYVVLVSRNHEALSARFAVACGPWDTVEPLLDKVAVAELARDAGVAHPEQHCPATVADLDALLGDLDFSGPPWILKSRRITDEPVDPVTGRRTRFGGRDAASLRKAAMAVYRRAGRFPVIERVVPGTAADCVGVTLLMGDDREPSLLYAVRRLTLARYGPEGDFHPYEKGANALCETVHDAEARAAAVKLVRRSGYTGLITVEFRRSASDGVLHLVKLEPRPVAATSLGTAIGLDVGRALYAMHTGVVPGTPDDYPDGVTWLWIDVFARTVVKHLALRDVRAGLGMLVRDAHSVRAFALAAGDDPLPFLGEWALHRARHAPVVRAWSRVKRWRRLRSAPV